VNVIKISSQLKILMKKEEELNDLIVYQNQFHDDQEELVIISLFT